MLVSHFVVTKNEFSSPFLSLSLFPTFLSLSPNCKISNYFLYSFRSSGWHVPSISCDHFIFTLCSSLSLYLAGSISEFFPKTSRSKTGMKIIPEIKECSSRIFEWKRNTLLFCWSWKDEGMKRRRQCKASEEESHIFKERKTQKRKREKTGEKIEEKWGERRERKKQTFEEVFNNDYLSTKCDHFQVLNSIRSVFLSLSSNTGQKQSHSSTNTHQLIGIGNGGLDKVKRKEDGKKERGIEKKEEWKRKWNNI